VPAWSSTPVQGLVDALRQALLGRSMTVGTGADRVSFTLTDLTAKVGPQAAVSGQADEVVATATDVSWRHWRVTLVRVRFANVHTRFGTSPTLVSAPVDVTATVAADAVRGLLPPRFVLDEVRDGAARVRWSRMPRAGWLDLRPELDHGTVLLRPVAVGRGGRSRYLPERLPAIRPRLALPDDTRVTGLRARAGEVEVRARVDERRLDLRQVMALARRKPATGEA
jgi:hypothetical protein